MEEEENNDNPAKIMPATRNWECKEKRRCDQELGETINDLQNDLNDGEELGVAPPRRSEHEHGAATTMTHDKDFRPTMKKSHAQVAKEQVKENTRQNTEEMIALQQSHNVNSPNVTTQTTVCMKHKC